jgi:hypothetical protein
MQTIRSDAGSPKGQRKVYPRERFEFCCVVYFGQALLVGIEPVP